jgi:DUF1365 family protein
MTTQSALYVGTVMHCRLRPRLHRFRYRAFWLYLDLDELDALRSKLWLFSHNRANAFSLNDSDHGNGGEAPLRAQIEYYLATAGIDIAGGAVRLLFMPRTFGYSFNPLSIYYCFRADGALAAILYEVHNTFGDRHTYLFPVEVQSDSLRQDCGKQLHVSPFMDMDMRYEFQVTRPSERVSVAIRVNAADQPVLTACLAGERRELSDGALLRLFLAMPAITLKVIMAIHWEALRLWLKGMRFRRRPAPPDRAISLATNTLNRLD